MGYTGNTWVNNSTPAISAENLNKMEKGIRDAHTGVEEAKLLADTNTIFIQGMLDFTSAGKRYKIPIDDFSFEKYWIFGWSHRNPSSSNIGNNIHSFPDGDTGRGWFEVHKSGIFIYFNGTGSDNHLTVQISDEGIITEATSTSGIKVFVSMCIIPVSKKNFTEL